MDKKSVNIKHSHFMLLEISAYHCIDFCFQEGDRLVGISDVIYLPGDKRVTLAV